MKLLIVDEEPQAGAAHIRNLLRQLAAFALERRDVFSRDERGASRDGRVLTPRSAAPTVGCTQ